MVIVENEFVKEISAPKQRSTARRKKTVCMFSTICPIGGIFIFDIQEGLMSRQGIINVSFFAE
jgi:hypothetical protein